MRQTCLHHNSMTKESAKNMNFIIGEAGDCLNLENSLTFATTTTYTTITNLHNNNNYFYLCPKTYTSTYVPLY